MAETCSDTLYDVTIDALSESDDDGNIGNECDNDFNPYIARKNIENCVPFGDSECGSNK